MNTLAQRLKFAKRELTALKTAHRRGLGNVKIYTYTYYFDDEGIGTLTVKFSRKFAPNPFVYVVMSGEEQGPWYFGITNGTLGMRYTDGGYTALISTQIFWGASGVYDRLVVYSTAPIESVNWREDG